MKLAPVNFRPTVSYLATLKAINYTPHHAIAEFIDNSLQSYIDNKPRLKNLHNNYKLKIHIRINSGSIEIEDNAAGISNNDYHRAFQTALKPKKQTGLSEFGMGMKTAACWFCSYWSVKSKALGEDIEKTIKVDVTKMADGNIEWVPPEGEKSPKNKHGTLVRLEKLQQPVRGASVANVKRHLTSIYREFIKRNEIEIRYNDEILKFEYPFKVLVGPLQEDLEKQVKNPKSRIWKRKFDFTFKTDCKHKKHRVTGFAAVADKMHKTCGMSIFRRSRLLKGSDDVPWRPLKLVGQEGSTTARRLFGEIHFDDDMEVTHTKDNLQWTPDQELAFLKELKSVINSDFLPIIKQADDYRKPSDEITKTVDKAGASKFSKTLPKVLGVLQSKNLPISISIPTRLPTAKGKNERLPPQRISLGGVEWTVIIVLNYGEKVNQKKWLDYSYDKKKNKTHIEIQILMRKGFSSHYFGNDKKDVEGMIALCSYIVLSEIEAKRKGIKESFIIREYINRIIDELPPTID
jgi:hypothetical protein|tara:strand:+ start:396 stop:1949 length:1554 start_codon:yes stop_codon:yes gene_type:complete